MTVVVKILIQMSREWVRYIEKRCRQADRKGPFGNFDHPVEDTRHFTESENFDTFNIV